VVTFERTHAYEAAVKLMLASVWLSLRPCPRSCGGGGGASSIEEGEGGGGEVHQLRREGPRRPVRERESSEMREAERESMEMGSRDKVVLFCF
jgi:hypothetical protein